MVLKFYPSVAKGLKLKVKNFWGLIPTFIEVTGEELVGPLILNRVDFQLIFHVILYFKVRSASPMDIGCKLNVHKTFGKRPDVL